MDQKKIIAAVKAVLPGVTKVETPLPGQTFDSDGSLVRQATNVGIQNRALFDEFVVALRQDATLHSLERKECVTGLLRGSKGPITLSALGEAILAQVFATGDLEKTVSDFAEVITSNSSDELIVLSLRGVSIDQKVDLGGNVQLLPLTDIPPSIPRGAALSNPHYPYSPRFPQPASAALVTKIKTTPIIGTPNELLDEEASKATNLKYQSALSLLGEALNCLTLVDMVPLVQHLTWSQFTQPAATFIGSPAWSYSQSPPWVVPINDLDISAAERQCQAYFAIPSATRKKVLHVPLDRLSRALGTDILLVDKAIDLGIGLEALLLHDLGKTRTELSYRFRLRGALLLETDFEKRKQMKKHLEEIYSLRSKAVHIGLIEDSAAVTLREGMTTCARLIRLVIEKRGVVDFEALELGK